MGQVISVHHDAKSRTPDTLKCLTWKLKISGDGDRWRSGDVNLDSFGPLVILAFPVPSSQADLHDHAFGKEGWYPLLLSALGKLRTCSPWDPCVDTRGQQLGLWNFEFSPDGLVKVLTRKRRSSCSSRHANKSGQHLNFWAGWDSWQLFEETGGMCFLLWELFFPSEVLLWGFLQATAWDCYPTPDSSWRVFSHQQAVQGWSLAHRSWSYMEDKVWRNVCLSSNASWRVTWMPQKHGGMLNKNIRNMAVAIVGVWESTARA